MSVAAVNSSNVVADFSSRGPTPCVDEESSLKIKPEVSAPGVNVRSCVGTDGYNALQGTSMACPHVSGALLLLAEAFPMASARELKEALYYSAIDLGDEGEDNTYGMGMIDVMAAYNYLSNTYTPTLPVPNDFDISVELEMSYGVYPVNYDTVTCVESVPTVYATMQNNGVVDAGDVMLFVYSGDSLIANITWDNVLAGVEVGYMYEIPEVPVRGGLNELRAVVTSSCNAIEYDTYNNSAMLRFNKYYNWEFPYTIDFNEGGFFSRYGVFIGNPNGLKTWEMLPWGENSDHYALVYRFSKNAKNKDVDYVYLPQTDLPDVDSIFLNFIYAYKNRISDSMKDSLFVEISTDCGATFPYRIWANGGPGLYTVSGYADTYYVPEDYAEFDTVSVSLADFRGQNVMVRLAVKNGRNSDLYISQIMLDNLCLSGFHEDYSSVATPQIEVYPNPANGFVNVFVPSEYLGSRCGIYDVYGKVVEMFNVDNQYHNLDLSRLVDGVYFIRIEGSDVHEKIVLLKK